MILPCNLADPVATAALVGQAEEALGELVAQGLVTADSFAGLRAHLRARAQAGRRRNWLLFGERTKPALAIFSTAAVVLLAAAGPVPTAP